MTRTRAGVYAALIALLACAAAGFSVRSLAADAGRGAVLYETRCIACHERSVHNRDARKAQSFDALRAQVRRWSAEVGGSWSADEINDVTLYLNRRYYGFDCPRRVCRADQASLSR